MCGQDAPASCFLKGPEVSASKVRSLTQMQWSKPLGRRRSQGSGCLEDLLGQADLVVSDVMADVGLPERTFVSVGGVW